MRTVTFADPTVIHYLKNHFVLLWHNQPGVNADPPAASDSPAYDEGGGGGNLRSMFCTADGRIRYALQGYWGVERFLARARLGHDLVVKSAALAGAEQQRMAGKELTRHLWDLAAERRWLRAEHADALARKASAPARDDARLALLERAVLASADLFGDPVAPILADLERKNRAVAT